LIASACHPTRRAQSHCSLYSHGRFRARHESCGFDDSRRFATGADPVKSGLVASLNRPAISPAVSFFTNQMKAKAEKNVQIDFLLFWPAGGIDE
jgi:hypothetical protein